MELEYIGKLLPNGHLSVNPSVAKKIKKGQKLKIRIEIYEEEKTKNELSGEAEDLLSFLKRSTHRGGYIEKEITREFIHKNRILSH